jgi:hypothetical protein
MVRGWGWGSLVSSRIRLLPEEDLAEAAEAVAERAGAEVNESFVVEIDRTGGASDCPDF